MSQTNMNLVYFYFKGLNCKGEEEAFIGTFEGHETEAWEVFEREYQPQRTDIFELYCPCCLPRY